MYTQARLVWCRSLLLPLAVAASALPAARAQDQVAKSDAVAIITELTGKAERIRDSGASSVSLLSEFAPGQRVKVHPDSRVVVLFMKSGEQFLLTGPAVAKFQDAAPEPLSGNLPVRMKPVSGKDGKVLRIRPGSVTQAGIVARAANPQSKKVQAMTLADTITLETNPTFRWQELEQNLEYKVSLKDARGDSLFSATVKGDSLRLPQEIALNTGEVYRWTVVTKASTGRGYAGHYTFTVADPDLRNEVENFRPGPDAPVSDQIGFTIWLEQMGLHDEARHYWSRFGREGEAPPPAPKQPPQN